MDKMLVDNLGDVTVTNDGATILKEMDVQHPVAKMLVEVAKAVDDEVGDGTTSSVILAGALLEKAEELIRNGIHPTIIVDGYRKALNKSLDILSGVAIGVDIADEGTLEQAAKTSMESKIVSVDSGLLARLAVKAVLAVATQEGRRGGDGESLVVVNNNSSGAKPRRSVDLSDIKVAKRAGGSMGDSFLVEGVIVDKEVAHPAMPRHIDGAHILLLNSPLGIEKTEFEARISIDRPEQMQMFVEEESRMLKAMADKVTSSGSNVVICQKGIDDLVLHHLARAGLAAVKNVKGSDIAALSKATMARIVTNLEDLVPADLGSAGLVNEHKVEGGDRWVFVEKCINPRAVSILLRGGSQRVVDEAERSMHDALMVVKDIVERPAIVAGGGAPEAYVAGKIREWSAAVAGREHYAIAAFADALESIPLTLAENAGMDLIDTLTQVRATQSSSKSPWVGVDVKTMKVGDIWERKVVEPLAVKEQVLKSATEVAAMVLRIDDILASSTFQSAKPQG
jgi:thermosome